MLNKIIKFSFSSSQKSTRLKFFDIAANLADKSFSGIYYEKKWHDSDVDEVIKRAENDGCDRLLIVGGYIEDSEESFELCQKNDKFFCTVGVHPCRAQVFYRGINYFKRDKIGG